MQLISFSNEYIYEIEITMLLFYKDPAIMHILY